MIGPTWKDLLNNPGYHSGKPETWKDATKQSNDLMKQKMELAMKLAKKEEDLGMEGLISEINQSLKDERAPSFMLVEPAQVTIKKFDGSFAKRPLIGGEEFYFEEVYLGKKGEPIFVFAPVDADNYRSVEMSEKHAKSLMTGFSSYIDSLTSGAFEKIAKETRKKKSEEVERERNAGKFEQYAELGFGTF